MLSSSNIAPGEKSANSSSYAVLNANDPSPATNAHRRAMGQPLKLRPSISKRPRRKAQVARYHGLGESVLVASLAPQATRKNIGYATPQPKFVGQVDQQLVEPPVS